jgi:hypothetical protein
MSFPLTAHMKNMVTEQYCMAWLLASADSIKAPVHQNSAHLCDADVQ